MDEIKSTSNPYIKYAASLQDGKVRKAESKFLIEGLITVTEAIKTGQVLEAIFVSEDFTGEIPATEARYVRVPSFVLKKITATVEPQGIAAIVVKRKPELCAKGGHCLVLDRISDPGNLGTILRTAAACGWENVYAIDCVDVTNPKVVRSSMTGVFYTTVFTCDYDFVTQKLAKTHALTVADMHGENVFSKQFSDRDIALVIGNEAHGVSDVLRSAAVEKISLPMKNVESLNAAISASVIMYQISNRTV